MLQVLITTFLPGYVVLMLSRVVVPIHGTAWVDHSRFQKELVQISSREELNRSGGSLAQSNVHPTWTCLHFETWDREEMEHCPQKRHV